MNRNRLSGRRLPLALLVLLACSCWSAWCGPPRPVHAQGTREDYARSKRLEDQWRGKLVSKRVEPQWLPGGERFWYRVGLPDGRHQFVYVEATSGRRQEAFDHDRVAKALRDATGQEVDPRRLPVSDPEFDSEGRWVRFRALGKTWRWDQPEGPLTQRGKASGEPRSASAFHHLRPSRNGGEEISVQFENRSGHPLRLSWIDVQGAKRFYAEIAAGAKHSQHTYAGHVWLLATQDEDRGAVFEASAIAPEIVLLAETLRPVRATAPARTQASGEPEPGKRRSSESPDGRFRAFLREHNVWLEDREAEREYALSSGGSEDDRYESRFFWSPDSRYLVALQSQPGEPRQVHLVDSAPDDQLQPRLQSFSYAKPGDRIDKRRPRLFDVELGEPRDVADTLLPNPWDLTSFRWLPDSSGFDFLYNQRGHQLLRLLRIDPASGNVNVVIEERSETFIDYAHKQFLHHVEGTGELVWMSERDGWNHLYLYDGTPGGTCRQLTRGEWVVRSIVRVDDQGRRIWFYAGGVHPDQNPYYEHLCRVDFDGSGMIVLTEADGTHRCRFSPDRRFLLDTWSRVDQPPVTELRRAEDGTLVCELERADWTALRAADWQPPEPFVAKGRDGQTDIHGIIIRPSNFDPDRRYPVIEQIYAGPHGSFVPREFGLQGRQRSLAELGFIVVQIDGMGTSHRSKAFHDVCWRNLADAGFPDRIAWLRQAAQKYPEMDLERVGIFGGSAGGQSALRALIAHPDVYKAAVADCGCHDNRMDKIWWNELWMGWPIGPHYAEQSNVTQAHRLQGKLLLIVGELDRNVDPSSTLQVVDALIQADKDFELLLMPGVGHGAAETPYGRRRRMDFFVRHLWHREPRTAR